MYRVYLQCGLQETVWCDVTWLRLNTQMMQLVFHSFIYIPFAFCIGTGQAQYLLFVVGYLYTQIEYKANESLEWNSPMKLLIIMIYL